MKITKKEILAKFNRDEMAGLLVGATEITNILRDLATSQMEENKLLHEKIKELESMKYKIRKVAVK